MKDSPDTRHATRNVLSRTLVPRPSWRVLLRLSLLALAILPVVRMVHAQEDDFWDRPFAKPLYLVHITETGTMSGPRERDDYILYPIAPEDGVLLTADGSGGYFINQAELAGGPFNTRREVCDGSQGIPEEKLSLGFDCRDMADADGDGVPDTRDLCPYTAPGAAVDRDGCAADCDIQLTCMPYADYQNVRHAYVGGTVSCTATYANPNGEEVTVRAFAAGDVLFDGVTNANAFDVSWTPGAPGRYSLSADVTFRDGRNCQAGTWVDVEAGDPGSGQDSDGDGVPDGQDACPNQTAQTQDGCPPGVQEDAPDEVSKVLSTVEEWLSGKAPNPRTPGEKAAIAALLTALIGSSAALTHLLNSGWSVGDVLSALGLSSATLPGSATAGVGSGLRWARSPWDFFRKASKYLGKGAPDPPAGSGRHVLEKGSPYYRTADELIEVIRTRIVQEGHPERYADEVAKLMKARGRQATRISEIYLQTLRLIKSVQEGAGAAGDAGSALVGAEYFAIDQVFQDPVSFVEALVMTENSNYVRAVKEWRDIRPFDSDGLGSDPTSVQEVDHYLKQNQAAQRPLKEQLANRLGYDRKTIDQKAAASPEFRKWWEQQMNSDPDLRQYLLEHNALRRLRDHVADLDYIRRYQAGLPRRR